MSEKTTYEAIDGRIAPESLTADTSAGSAMQGPVSVPSMWGRTSRKLT